MLFAESICAFMASGFELRTSLIFERIIFEIKYTLLAFREIILDWIHAKYNKNDCPPQTGRIAIVTGGSRGIGFEVVKMLLELDMEVILACRTTTAGEKAIQQIRKSGIQTGKAKVYKLDNASLESVKQFATDIKKDYKKIHALINNAGVMFSPYEETVEGHEQQWGVNYLSHFLLTALLLPLLKAGGLPEQCSRVVNVTSCAHLFGKLNFSDINSKNRFNTLSAYAQSKLAQETFNKMLQSLLQEKEYYVQSYSVHPGVVYTELFQNSYIWKFRLLFQRLIKTPRQGATSIVYAAVNKAVENSGGIYINNCLPAYSHPDASNASIQQQLLEFSLEQVQLNDFFQYV